VRVFGLLYPRLHECASTCTQGFVRGVYSGFTPCLVNTVTTVGLGFFSYELGCDFYKSHILDTHRTPSPGAHASGALQIFWLLLLHPHTDVSGNGSILLGSRSCTNHNYCLLYMNNSLWQASSLHLLQACSPGHEWGVIPAV